MTKEGEKEAPAVRRTAGDARQRTGQKEGTEVASSHAAQGLEPGPDLLAPPHMLAELMELFAGERHQALAQQDRLLAHLLVCEYCQTAVIFLFGVAQEYDRRSGDTTEPARGLREHFARIVREREASGYERLGAYAEAIVVQGREAVDRRYPGTAAHVSRCAQCRAALEETVAFLNEPEERP
jgi:hypothetical protein